MRALVVVPTYNERENISELLDGIYENIPGAHVLVVDDNSPDGTGSFCEQLPVRHEGRLHVLHREYKLGLAKAYIAGFRWALERGYEVVFQMDADLSHDPRYLPVLLRELERADLVLGSRYLHGINVVNWDLKRLLLSKAASWYARIITRMPFSDATGGFKCWSRAALSAIELDGVFSNGYLFQIEMTFKAFQQSFRIAEAPIIFYERNLGRSKMNWKIILEAIFGVLRLGLLRTKVRPVRLSDDRNPAGLSGTDKVRRAIVEGPNLRRATLATPLETVAAYKTVPDEEVAGVLKPTGRGAGCHF